MVHYNILIYIRIVSILLNILSGIRDVAGAVAIVSCMSFPNGNYDTFMVDCTQ